MAGRPWSDDEIERVRELVQQGATDKEISDALPGRTRSAVSQIRERYGIPAGSTYLPVVDEPAVEMEEGLRDYEFVGTHFIFVVNGKPLAVEFERWDAICRDYSEHGGNLTSAEIARDHGIPLPVLKRVLRAYGQYKASPPTCRERIEEHRADFTPLVAEAIENDEARFLNVLDRKRDTEWRKHYVELRNEDLTRQRMLEAAHALASEWSVPDIPKVEPNDGEAWEAHIPTTDEHAGKYNWSAETFGEDYSTDETCARLRRHAERTAEWIRGQPGRCVRIHRSLLGDLFHALTGQTEHGTKLDQDTRSARVLSKTMEALTYGVALLASVSDEVVVRGAKGNHDGFQFVFGMMLLKALCEKYPNVTVDDSPHYFNSFRVGTTLHVLDHGYRMGTIGGWKAKAQAETVAREVGGAEYHGCEMIYTYCGHLHEEQRGSHGSHLKLIRLPSLGESDDYETSLRYASLPSAHLFRLDHRGRICDERVLYRDALRELAAA